MDLLRDFRSRFAVTAGALAGFALIYPFIYAWGGPGMTALCALPILVAGYLFGLRAGAIVGFVIFPLSVLELVAFRVPAADLRRQASAFQQFARKRRRGCLAVRSRNADETPAQKTRGQFDFVSASM